MSHIGTRKSGVSEEKDRGTDNPVKDMKKKMAANAEKEKQITDKQSEKDKTKQAEKPVEKAKHSEKPAEKPKQVEKPADKPVEKTKQVEKSAEKPKQNEKSADKSDKSTVSDKKVEKNGVEKKADSKEKKEAEKKDDKHEKSVKDGKKPKQNGSKANGVETNGVEEGSDDDVIEICDDEFPELAYEDSDNESPTPDNAPGRSLTRRSQVKATRTPETPQPAAEKSDKSLDKPSDKSADKLPDKSADKLPDKPAENASSEDSKESKLQKVADTPDRKLRSADSPKPESKKDKDSPKPESKKDKDSPKKDKDSPKKDKENGEKLEVVLEIEMEEEPRKTDTNYSKSRVKVSPYRRSMRLADQTTSSVMANYTGNNTTMEMDITESSMSEETSMDDSYLNGLKSIRGRRSYKPLKEMTFKHVNRSVRSTASGTASEMSSRPTGTVVGRKRKPEGDETVEIATEAGELSSVVHSKRMRLLDRIAQPFRRTLASTPLPARRNAEIVGINTDLPQTVPVASSSTFDPETLKSNPTATPVIPPPVLATPPATPEDKDNKRCIVM